MLLASGTGNITSVTDTGIPLGGGLHTNAYLVQFGLQSGFVAAGNTAYWLGIHLATDYNDNERVSPFRSH